jgi:response regulator RpfG family c-di-GMP phosphodiesterase
MSHDPFAFIAGSVHVLIVDDEPDHLKLTTDMLRCNPLVQAPEGSPHFSYLVD